MRRGRRVRRRRSLAARILDIALAAAFLGMLAVVSGRILVTDSRTLSGTARVADGDTLTIDGERIRIEGIDAPELSQSCTRNDEEWPCGRQARERLVQLAAGRAVTCETSRRDRYGRLLARCTAAGVDLGLALVEEGWAVAYGNYQAAESHARRARLGIWSGSFEQPQDWRRSHGSTVETSFGHITDWLVDIWYGLKSRFVQGED